MSLPMLLWEIHSKEGLLMECVNDYNCKEDYRGTYAMYYTDKAGERQEFHVLALDSYSALGMFFIENPTICFNDIIDTMEI